jgi:ATP/maltotriose-dependent transcriptional regulator MalT/DNA-binding SARP family transcriptional activator
MGPDPTRSAATVTLVLSHRLTLVVAAAGWGKSTLLRRLAAEPTGVIVTRPPVGWTPFSLARSLIDALGGSDNNPDGAGGALPAYATADSQDRDDQVAALAAAVSSVAADVVRADTIVAIDAPPGDPLERFLEALVLGLPPQLHLVLACRTQPTMRLARLRAAGDVARVNAADLAITTDALDRLEASAGADPAVRPVLDEIVSATGGWPLAVHLAVEAMRRTGPLDRATLVDHLLEPHAVLFEYLAEDVLAGLDDPARELLALAGTVPVLSPELLDRIGRGDLTAALEALTTARIFLEPLPGRRGHSAVTLLGGAFARRVLPPPALATLRDVVDALVGLGNVDDALAVCRHVGDGELALRAALAVDRPDQLAATSMLDEILTLADPSARHPHVAELRGDLHYFAGAWDDALAAYGTAAALGSGNATRVARKQANILYLRGRFDEANAIGSAVASDGSDPAEEARVLACRAVICWARGDAAGCGELVEPAERLAVQSGDDAALATVFTAKAMLAALQGDLPANRRHYQRALDHAERAGDVGQIVRIRTNRGSRLTSEGDYAEALTELDQAIWLAELAGSDTFSALAHCNRGEALLLMGRLDAALTETRRAQAIWTRLGSDRMLYALVQLGQIQALRGQRSEAISIFNEAVRLAKAHGDTQGVGPGLVGLARSLESDDLDAAESAAQRAIDSGNPVWMPLAYAAAASVALRRGQRDRALHLATDAIAIATRRRDRRALGEALLVRAALDRPPSAAVANEAKRLWEDLGNPIGEARADVLLAATVNGHRRDELLAEAERRLYEAGALGLLAEIRGAGAAGGTTASPITITTLGGFRVTRDGEPVDIGEWGSRKARDLVKLLVARRGAPVVRDEVAEMLWPDEPDRSARRLSVLLSTVRSVFDPDKARPADHYVAADHDTVWLVREHVDIDVEQFIVEAAEGRRRLAAGDTDRAARLLNDAAARYLGEFCADDPYADWAAGLRELAKHTFVDTSFELAGLADASGEHSEAIRSWLRILDVDPYDEDAHLGMIRSLLAQRRHGEARRAYRAYCARLAELDLDAAPFPTLTPA